MRGRGFHLSAPTYQLMRVDVVRWVVVGVVGVVAVCLACWLFLFSASANDGFDYSYWSRNGSIVAIFCWVGFLLLGRKRGISSNGGGCVSKLGYRKSLRYVRSATSNQDFVWVEAVRRHNALI